MGGKKVIKTLQTARLNLIPACLADQSHYYQMDSSPAVMQYIGALKDKEASMTFLKRKIDQFDNGLGWWSIFLKEDGRFIGACTLQYLDNTREVELGYKLLPAYWGRGLATECAKEILRYGMNDLKYNRIVAVTNPQNNASINVLQKLGLKFEKKAWHYQSEVNYFAIEV